MPGTESLTTKMDGGANASASSPYVGLGFYTQDKSEFFFGRDGERQVLMGNLRAARLTLLYAESGVGKSSLLRAGVAARLEQIARTNFSHGQPAQIPVVFSAWKDDPIDDLIVEIESTVAAYVGDPPRLPRENLVQAIETALSVMDRTIARTAGEDDNYMHGTCSLLIILDQFEEHFLYGSREQRPGRLADELAEAINRRDLNANFLIAIREDAYSELGNLLRGRMSNVYGNYVHLDYMRAGPAREAIEGPIARYNQLHTNGSHIDIEPGLVEALLEEVRHDGAEAQNGNAPAAPADGQIETPYLQLVMATLWERERANGSQVLRRSTLEELQGAKQIVASHLAGALSALPERERDVAVDALHHLVTPSGTKIALEVGDLAAYTERPVSEVAPVLERLAGGARILRSVPPAPGKSATDPASQRYEIYHDVLAGPINATVSAQSLTRARRRLVRARRIAGGAAALALLALAGLIATAILLHAEKVAKHDARSSLVASRAEDQLASDPELATLLAVKAYGIAHTSVADKALRDALPRLQLQRTLHIQPAASSAAFSPAGDLIAAGTEDGVVHLWSAHTYRPAGTLGLPGLSAVDCVAFSFDGRSLLVGYGDGSARVWTLAAHRQPGSVMNASDGGAVYACAEAPNGRTLATGSADGRVRLWNPGTTSPRTLLGKDTGVPLTGVAISPDGSSVAASSLDGSTRLWSLQSGGSRSTMYSGNPVYSVAFSPDGQRLVTTTGGGLAELWSTVTHQHAGTLEPQGGWNILQGATFSPSGRLIATAGLGAPPQLWRTPSAGGNPVETKPLRALPRATGSTQLGAAFDRSGGRVLAVGADGVIRVWDTTQGKLLRALAAGGADVAEDAAVNPNGQTVATAGRDSGVTIWKAVTGAAIAHISLPNRASVASVDYSGQGHYLLAAGDNGKAYALDSTTGALLSETSAATAYSTLVAARFNPADARQLLTAGQDQTNGPSVLRLWRTLLNGTSTVTATFTEPGGAYVNNARFSPDGTRIVTSDSSGHAYIWSTSAHKPIGAVIAEPHSAHTDAGFNSAAFSAAGGLVITGSNDGTARIWDAISPAHRLLATFAVPAGDAVLDAALSGDGRTVVAAARNGAVYTWDLASRRQLNGLMGHSGAVNRLAITSDGSRAITASADGTAKLWSLQPVAQDGAPIVDGTLQDMVTGTFSPNGRILAIGDSDGTTTLWSASPTHSLIATLPEPGHASVSSAEFEPHGTRLVTADGNGAAVVWNAAHHLVHELPDPSSGSLTSAVFSPDGGWIVTAGANGARIWSATSFKPVRRLAAGSDVRWAAVSPDSRLVATAGQDSTVSLWDLATGRQRYATITEPDQQPLSGVWFSPVSLTLDGRVYPRDTLVVTSSEDGTARIWDAVTGAQLRGVTEPGRSAIFNAVISPNGHWLLTASQDGTGRVWDVATGRLLTTFYAGNPVSDAEFSPSSDRVVLSTSWGTARVFTTALAGSEEAVLAYARTHLTRELTPDELRRYVNGA